MAPAQNITIPPGWSDHGIDGLICKPAGFIPIASFFLSNYIAHLFSLKWYPAETHKERATAMIAALFYPAFGLLRAFEHLRREASGGIMNLFRHKNELERAQEAEALCMVVRAWNWQPDAHQVGHDIPFVWVSSKGPNERQAPRVKHSSGDSGIQNDTVELGLLQAHESEETDRHQHGASESDMSGTSRLKNFQIRTPSWYRIDRTNRAIDTIQSRGCEVHGRYSLPPGYMFAYVPRSAALTAIPNSQEQNRERLVTHVSSNDGWISAVISIYQICASSVTLYRARGDQITRYGYAAFGLTVIPYILMTMINLVSQIFTRSYSMLYLIRGPEMDEAILRGGYFDGTIGQLEPVRDVSRSIQYYGLETFKVEVVKNDGDQDLFTLSSSKTGTSDFIRKTKAYPEYTDVYIPCCSPFERKLAYDDPQSTNKWLPYMDSGSTPAAMIILTPLLLVAIVICIYGAISRFDDGMAATSLQRGFILTWIILGSYGGWIGLVFRLYGSMIQLFQSLKAVGLKHGLLPIVILGVIAVFQISFTFVAFAVSLTPAVGGMIIVGLMMKDFGECVRI